MLSNMVYTFLTYNYARLAQLVRASRLHREGRGFESLGAHYQTDIADVCFFITLRLELVMVRDVSPYL